MLLRAQSVPTAKASALEDVLSVRRAHADAETMRLVAMSVVGLVGPLHEKSILKGRMRPRMIPQMERNGETFPAFDPSSDLPLRRACSSLAIGKIP